eukprot:13551614-Alexandrium_andersonii.AAC.1
MCIRDSSPTCIHAQDHNRVQNHTRIHTRTHAHTLSLSRSQKLARTHARTHTASHLERKRDLVEDDHTAVPTDGGSMPGDSDDAAPPRQLQLSSGVASAEVAGSPAACSGTQLDGSPDAKQDA